MIGGFYVCTRVDRPQSGPVWTVAFFGDHLKRLDCMVQHLLTRLATVQSGPDRGLFWRLLKRLDCTVQSFVRLDWTIPKDRTVRR